MQEKTIYFVRHGQSEGNVSDTFQPPESPLTELGRQQAEQVAQRAQKLSFEALLVSPYVRTRQTAEPIVRATGMEPEFVELFKERVKPTRLNGASYDDADAQALWKQWEKGLFTPGVRAEDGENYDDIVTRSTQALEYLRDRSESSLLVVTHGFILRAMMAVAIFKEGISPDILRSMQYYLRTENAGITVFRWQLAKYETEPSWYVMTFNDHAHLG